MASRSRDKGRRVDSSRTQRAFLDNNIWNVLASGRGSLTVDALVGAFRSGRIEVVGTMELFEELMGTATRRPTRYERMRQLWRQLCAKRILWPIDERHSRELETGGQLRAAEMYVPSRVVREAARLSARPTVVKLVNDEVRVRKQRHLTRDLTARDQMVTELAATGKKVSDFDRRVTVDVVRDVAVAAVAAGASYGLPTIPTREVTPARLPSFWLFVAYSAARATRIAGENRAVKASDNHDGLHCAAAAYFDVLVTDDNEFRATLALIPDLPFEVLGSSAFADRLAEWRLQDATSSTSAASPAGPEERTGVNPTARDMPDQFMVSPVP